MPIFETYSDRKRKAAASGQCDPYFYDALPEKLRIQLSQIFAESVGGYHEYGGYEMHTPPENNELWVELLRILKRSFGREYLHMRAPNPKAQILGFIRAEADVDDALSAIEVCCIALDRVISKYDAHDLQHKGISRSAKDALEEVNYRFRDAGVGYQFESGQIMRVDSQFAHAEIVKPALGLLSDKRFAGAEAEFLKAHTHYRSGEYKDAVIWANNAFESTLKIACDIKGWKYEKGARASDLVKLVKKHGLWPDYLDSSFDQLIATLSSGLPKVRNEEGGHGGGAEQKQTPTYVAAYALHLAAAKILLISEAALGKR